MVKFSKFGPLTGGKPTPIKEDLSNEKSCKVQLIAAHDMEANILLAKCSRRRASSSRILTCVADFCALLALLLVIFATMFLLYKVWWVKTEVDKMAPAVAQLSADISRLRAEAEALQGQNDAFAGSMYKQPLTDDSFPMEDIATQALRQMEELGKSIGDSADGGQNKLVMKLAMLMMPKQMDSIDVQNFTLGDGMDFFPDTSKNSQNGDSDQDQEPLSDQEMFKTLLGSSLTPSMSVSLDIKEDESGQDIVSTDAKKTDIDDDDESGNSSDDESEDQEAAAQPAADSDSDGESTTTAASK